MKTIDAFGQNVPLATETNNLASRLWRLVKQGDVKTVLLTSAIRGEGKSTTAAQLAAATAMYPERRVALVDLDFRLSSLARHFDVSGKVGLAEYIRNECSLKEATQKTSIPNLEILPAGRNTEQPDRLVSSPRLGIAIRELRDRYDLVLMDGPAMVPVADATSFTTFADGVLLVVMVGKTSRLHLARIRETCLGMGARILGIVVINAQEAVPDLYHREYYGSYAAPSARQPVDPHRKPSGHSPSPEHFADGGG